MKVLVIGSGGREFVLSRIIASSPLVESVFRAPGNGGRLDKTSNVNINGNDIPGLKKFALENGIDLTVVGPEDPLVKGIVDEFESAGLHIIGPRKKAAALEGSKIFTRELLEEINVPQPRFSIFSDVGEARAFIRDQNDYPVVIKVDGLAAGKGAMVCHDPEDVDIALRRIGDGEFKDAGIRFLVEGFLEGEEASYIVLVDKNGHIFPLAGSQDHKAIYDNDEGPNTGGTGAYSPAPVLNSMVEQRVLDRIVKPTIKAMAERDMPFCGFFYVGLMIDKDACPSVVEFNVRLGDPETQPILARMKTDIVEIFQAMVKGELDKIQIEWDPRVAVCVVMMEDGYPGDYDKGHVITGLDELRSWKNTIVDLAAVIEKDDKLLTSGGRVLGVTALGEDHAAAIGQAYQAVKLIHWGSEYYRSDIGKKALNR
ncbi:MAG: phosphoribosylamine--glycine ligase [Deltaproteobacteria bacterium]|nr:phosphoribosylamine--glycine ligase [Deltaproteobacteria bacterium]